MTLIQLVQRLFIEGGISGSISTVTGATGEALRCVNWIKSSWYSIQSDHDEWDWMRTACSFTTTDAKANYLATAGAGETGVADLGVWKRDSFRIYVTSTGYSSETFLSEMDYDAYRDMYQFGSLRTQKGQPICFAVNPNKSLSLGLTPDATGFTVVGEYYAQPSDLSVDADTPGMPSRFHMAIVWRALIHYALYEAAPEVLTRAQNEYNIIMSRLEADQLPQVVQEGPLA